MSPELNYVAVLVAGLVYWLIGGLWYSPILFVKPWMEAMGFKKDDPQMGGMSPMKAMGAQAVMNLLSAYVLAHILATYQATTVSAGLTGAFWVWLGFMFTLGMSQVFFERKPWKVFFINQGYNLAGMLAMGAILASWK